jgi:hypothetical protein
VKSLLFFILVIAFSNLSFSQDVMVYTLLNKGDAAELNEKISKLNESKIVEKAYKGALLAKKADLVGTPKDKLQVFKSGAALLEAVILEAPENIEFRLLRYIIQCNAPSFLGYNKNINEDKVFVEKSELNKVTKQIVLDFNKANTAKAIALK